MSPDETKWGKYKCPGCGDEEISFEDKTIEKYGDNLLCWECSQKRIAALQADLDEAAGLLEQTNNYAEGAGCDYCGWTGCYFCGPRMKWLVAIAAFLAKKEAK